MLARLVLTTSLLALLAGPAAARTGKDLSSRIQIDGLTGDFTVDETVFCTSAPDTCDPLESSLDSRWGPNNDFNQIRITWDAKNLYIAGEGVIWDNNMIIFLDVLPGRGLKTMRELQSWRRNFTFSEDFAPDVFIATWDRNTAPRLLVPRGDHGPEVQDLLPGEFFHSVASFSQGERGRAMEFAIPWNTVFVGTDGVGTRAVVAGGDTFQVIPYDTLRVAGVITTGADGLGGPDSAPDNTRGHTSEAADPVVVDNFAIIALDLRGDRPGFASRDSVPDLDAEPKGRVSYLFAPPVQPLRFEIKAVGLNRPAFSPELGEKVKFDITLTPTQSEPRQVEVTANIFDLRGRFVRNLYVGNARTAITPGNAQEDFWDGRDEAGQVVDAGVYILRVVLEPNESRVTKAIVVVR